VSRPESLWFDLAVGRLGTEGVSDIGSDAVSVFENDYPVRVDSNDSARVVESIPPSCTMHGPPAQR